MNHQSKSAIPPWVVRPITPEEVYTNRNSHLEFLYNSARKAITRRSMSTVLLGQRRMGKTEIFKRVVNRLFFEQKDYADINASAVPVFYTFEERAIDKWEFSEKYVENFLRWYTAFRLRNPDILLEDTVKRAELIKIIREKLILTKGLQGALNLFEALPGRDVINPDGRALWLPRRVSDRDESTVVVFLDEFQNTRMPQHNFDIVGLMQEAVESPTCPHFVTGSAMCILASEILGRGSLFGRFESDPIVPLTEYWGSELALRAARFYGAVLGEDMAPVLATRCGGNPFYITAVIRQSIKQNKTLSDEQKINEILAVDLSSGFIWAELNDQVERWIIRINEYGITKWVLYLSALEPGDRIDLERIQKELYERDRKKVSIETIRNVLIKLSRGDLLEYLELGGWFRKVDDPILLEFLKVWGKIIVEGKRSADVQTELVARYSTLQRQLHDYIGYVGEVHMAQILWNSQNKTLPAKYFHVPDDIPVSWHFSYIRHRVRLAAAAEMEVDVYAAAGSEVWLCESKWWRGKKPGVKEVKSLIKKGNKVKENMGETLKILRLWFFAYDSFTAEAQALMQDKGILWSDRCDLDALLSHVGLKRLPEL